MKYSLTETIFKNVCNQAKFFKKQNPKRSAVECLRKALEQVVNDNLDVDEEDKHLVFVGPESDEY